MTLPVQDRKSGPYTGNGTLTQYGYDFRIENAADLKVYVDDTLRTDYAVSGVGVETGGSVTFDVAPIAGAVIWIFGNQPVEQQDVSLQQGGEIQSTNLELSLDKYVMMMQDRLITAERAPLLKESTTLRNVQFPDPIPSHVIGWNAAGNGLEAVPGTILQVIVDPVSGWANGKTTTVITAVNGVRMIESPAPIPAGVSVQHVSWRNTAEWGDTQGLTTFSLGEPEIQDAWDNKIPRTNGYFSTAGKRRRHVPFATFTTLPLRLVAEAGLFDASGQGNITVHWSTYLADT